MLPVMTATTLSALDDELCIVSWRCQRHVVDPYIFALSALSLALSVAVGARAACDDPNDSGSSGRQVVRCPSSRSHFW